MLYLLLFIASVCVAVGVSVGLSMFVVENRAKTKLDWSLASAITFVALLFVGGTLSSWIKENAASFRQEDPRGTGEHDFALLRITRSLRKDTFLPERFPYLTPEMGVEAIRKDLPVLLASYPAGFLGSIAIQKDLYQTSTVTKIKELFTFKNGSVEAFSVGGNIVAQKGSSGSGVVSLSTGRLLGIIVTSTDGQTTADRDLQAIIFPHMSESMQKDIDSSLEEFLSGDIIEKSKNIST